MTDRELMQMALDVMEAAIKAGDWKVDGACDPDLVLTVLRARLAQPEPEPVAWWDGAGRFATAKEKDWDRRTGGILSAGRDIPLYTAPPQREWQGLTDEEVGMLTVFDGLHHVETPLLADFARAIEAKLKEKNGY